VPQNTLSSREKEKALPVCRTVNEPGSSAAAQLPVLGRPGPGQGCECAPSPATLNEPQVLPYWRCPRALWASSHHSWSRPGSPGHGHAAHHQDKDPAPQRSRWRRTKQEAQPTLFAARPETERYFPGIMAEDSAGCRIRLAGDASAQSRDIERGRLPGNPLRGYHGNLHFRSGPFPSPLADPALVASAGPCGDLVLPRRRFLVLLPGPHQNQARESSREGREAAEPFGGYDNRHFRSVPLYGPPPLGPREICVPLLSASSGQEQGGGGRYSTAPQWETLPAAKGDREWR
jgi:hypothetical protein